MKSTNGVIATGVDGAMFVKGNDAFPHDSTDSHLASETGIPGIPESDEYTTSTFLRAQWQCSQLSDERRTFSERSTDGSLKFNSSFQALKGKSDVRTRPDPSPNGDGKHEQRLKAPARTAARNGREMRQTGTGDPQTDTTLLWLQARLKLIIADWRNDLRADLTRIIRQIESVSSSEREWVRLRRQLNRVDPEFSRHITVIAPDLNKTERKVALLMGFGLPTEEIAQTLGTSVTDVAIIGSAVAAQLSARLSGVNNATP